MIDAPVEERPLISTYLTNRYNFLRNVALNIAPERGEELVSYLVEWMYTHPKAEELVRRGDRELEAYSVSLMKKSVSLPNSEFNSHSKRFRAHTFDQEDHESMENIVKRPELVTPPEETYSDPYEAELSFLGFSDEQILKLKRVHRNWRNLSPPLKRYYQLYFIDGFSTRQIAEIVKIPGSSSFELLKKLKQQLRK